MLKDSTVFVQKLNTCDSICAQPRSQPLLWDATPLGLRNECWATARAAPRVAEYGNSGLEPQLLRGSLEFGHFSGFLRRQTPEEFKQTPEEFNVCRLTAGSGQLRQELNVQSDEGPLQRTFHPSGVRTLSPSTTNIQPTPWLLQPFRGCVTHFVGARCIFLPRSSVMDN